jgi:vancomycin resistance protein YoaR
VDTAYSSTYSFDKAKFDNIVSEIYNEACAAPVDAGSPGVGDPVFDFSARAFTKNGFVPSVIGYTLDYDEFSKQAAGKLNEAFLSQEGHKASLDATAEPILSQPADVSGYGLLGTYTTHTTNVANRNTNISLAASTLTNTVIAPGQTYSFNGSLGNTTAAKGYKVAGILVNGKPSQGIGGGICQVSSTMYNAVLEAGMKIVERHAHSAEVGYVPKGRDATVSYGSLDFKWMNNKSSNIYMVIAYNNRSLTVSVYGKK